MFVYVRMVLLGLCVNILLMMCWYVILWWFLLVVMMLYIFANFGSFVFLVKRVVFSWEIFVVCFWKDVYMKLRYGLLFVLGFMLLLMSFWIVVLIGFMFILFVIYKYLFMRSS